MNNFYLNNKKYKIDFKVLKELKELKYKKIR